MQITIPTVLIASAAIMIFAALVQYFRDCRQAIKLIEPCARTMDELFERVRWQQHTSARGLEYALSRSGIWDILTTLSRIGTENSIDRYAICSAMNALCRHDVQWVASPYGYGVIFQEERLAGSIQWDLKRRTVEISEGAI